MSNCSLIDWFDQLLFGHDRENILEPPTSLYELICKLEADGIQWRDMIRQGGLTMFRYQIQGDLDVLLEYLDKKYLQYQHDTPLPNLHTRSMNHFFNQLLAIMARRDEIRSNELALATDDDKTILQSILTNSNASDDFYYKSAQFWGELARNFLTHRRPLPRNLSPLPPLEPSYLRKTARLYNITCQTEGKQINPLSMHMVPASQYVNAVHWQSQTLLEAFMQSRPNHILSRTVQKLILRALEQFLAGQYPSCLKQQDSNIATFLENAKLVHSTIPEASLLVKPPPLVIDVFQRLLALLQYDDLWRSVPCKEILDKDPTDLMHLTEQLHLADRQNRILLKYVGGD